jgi:ribonuclease R
MRRLIADRSRRHEFKRILRDLQRDNLIVKVEHDRYALPRSGGHRPTARKPREGGLQARRPRPIDLRHREAGTVSGRLQRHPRGFGFVTPDAGGPDIFIPPPAIGDRLSGDRVAVRVTPGDRGRAVGEIVRILERSRRRILGVFHAAGGRGHGGGPNGGSGSVETYDRQFEREVIIPAGDAGAARDGLVVGIEILDPPSERSGAVGRVVEVLGHPDEPGMDLRTIIRKYDLREEFAPDVLAESEAIAATVPETEIAAREDFRRLPIVTIDGETAKDFDDAVLVRKNADGSFELEVHIADVAHYVRAGSALDGEAYARGTSVYFPGTAIPMLPERLSNGICSLNPGVDRLVQSCLMTLDRQGKVTDYRFAQGVIRTVERMTYTDVARILVDRDPAVSARYRALVPTFRLMEELCGVLQAKRRRRGSIDFDLPEPEVILAVTGEMTGIQPLERNIAHRLIEEFMLAANETVAGHLWRARVPSLYRIHEKPDPKKLEEFDRVSQAFGYRLPRPFTAIAPGAFQDLLDMAKGRPEERFLSRLMLRSLKQARYSEGRNLHFGLAASCYTHFTSPIRRYPDLVVHRMLKRLLLGRPIGEADRQGLEQVLPETALHASRMERNADAAENELIEWKKMAFMADRLGEEFDGLIIAVHPFGFFVELLELYLDGLVPVDVLQDDRYQFLEKKQILKGDRHGRVFKLGDRIRVRVDRVNQVQLKLEFSPAEAPAGARGRPPVGGRGGGRGGGRHGPRGVGR